MSSSSKFTRKISNSVKLNLRDTGKLITNSDRMHLSTLMLVKETTKKCKNCGNTKLVLIRTQNLKICTDCNTSIPWNLSKNQKSLLVK